MIGICGRGEVTLVATIAGRWQSGVVVVYVAGGARDSDMSARKRKRRVVVIERGCGPGRCVVAGSAGRGEAGLSMIGIIGSVVVSLMAGVAICRNGCVVVVGMALRARDGEVSSGERESAS
jgi:hypothetical protein